MPASVITTQIAPRHRFCTKWHKVVLCQRSGLLRTPPLPTRTNTGIKIQRGYNQGFYLIAFYDMEEQIGAYEQYKAKHVNRTNHSEHSAPWEIDFRNRVMVITCQSSDGYQFSLPFLRRVEQAIHFWYTEGENENDLSLFVIRNCLGLLHRKLFSNFDIEHKRKMWCRRKRPETLRPAAADSTGEMGVLEQRGELRRSSSSPAPGWLQSHGAPVHPASSCVDLRRPLSGSSSWGRNCSH